MLRTILICPDPELAARLRHALEPFRNELAVSAVVEHYPDADEFEKLLRTHTPDALFVNFREAARGVSIARYLERQGSSIQVIAVDRKLDADRMRESMRAGVREYLADPFEADALRETMDRVAEYAAEHPAEHPVSEQLLSFLPARAGVGATTLALNIAHALGDLTKEGQRRQTLLSDLDLNSGMLRFLLKIKDGGSVADAIEYAEAADAHLWGKLVSRFGNMDVLHAGAINPNVRFDELRVAHLLSFMQNHYQVACCDCSANLERYALAAMEQSRQIYLVTTPEMPSVQVAREKAEYLKSQGLDGRTVILLNRVGPQAQLTAEQVSELAGLPVAASFPNAYEEVNQATADGRALAADSEMGRRCSAFAHQILGREWVEAPQPKPRKLLGFFPLGGPRATQASGAA